MPFQSVVNVQPAPAIAGDFASANPRWNVLAGPGVLVCGAAGVTVGRFACIAGSVRVADNRVPLFIEVAPVLPSIRQADEDRPY